MHLSRRRRCVFSRSKMLSFSAGYCSWSFDAHQLYAPSHLQSGGMPGISLARQAGAPNPNVSALVFARWVSLCYITLAQLRVVFPGGLVRLDCKRLEWCRLGMVPRLHSSW